jgi:hypothetical protein
MLLWTLVAFFGASIAFRAIRVATEDEPAWVSLAAGVAAFAVIVGVIVVIVRRQG